MMRPASLPSFSVTEAGSHLHVPTQSVAAGRDNQTLERNKEKFMRKTMMIALSAFAFSAAVPAVAQDAMASHDQMKASKKMSAADMKKVKACNAMSHDAMMKDAGCAKVMKAHPDMMKHDDMMKSGN